MRWTHLLAIALLVTVTHALWLGPKGHSMDEEFFAVQAATWARGGPPGVGTWDVAKTPGIALVYLAAFRLGGQSLASVHVAVALFVFGTAVALYAIGARLFGASGAFAGAILFVSVMQTFGGSCDTKALTTELVASGFIAGALALLVGSGTSPGLSRLAFAGLLCGCAVAVRQTSALYAPVLAVAVLASRGPTERRGWRAMGAVAALGAAATVVPAAIIAYYAHLGELTALYETSVLWPAKAGSAMPLRVGIVRGAYAVPHFFLLGAPVPTALAIAYYLSRTRSPNSETPRGLWSPRTVSLVWLAAACVAVAPSLRFMGYYFIQVLPPLCLASGGGLSWAYARPRGRALAASLTAVAALAGCVALNLDALRARVLRQEGIAAVGTESSLDRLLTEVERHAQPGDPIWIWGDFWPEVYWRTGCVPGARDLFGIVTAGYSFTRGHGTTVCYSPMAETILVDDLRSSRPRCIIDMTGSEALMARMRTHPRAMSDFPRLTAYIRSEYEPHPGPGNTVIYLPRRGKRGPTANRMP